MRRKPLDGRRSEAALNISCSIAGRCMLLGLLLGLVCTLSMVAPSYSQTPENRENRIRAAFIYYLSRFVNWPVDQTNPSDRDFRVCVLGGNDLRPFILEALKEKKINELPFQVEFFSAAISALSLRHCKLVYFGRDVNSVLGSLLPTLRELPILTVGSDSLDVTKHGGIVQLFKSRNKLRLKINLGAAKKAKLKLSAELLDIAIVVDE